MGGPGRKRLGSRSGRTDRALRGPCVLTESQTFSRPARPNSVNKLLSYDCFYANFPIVDGDTAVGFACILKRQWEPVNLEGNPWSAFQLHGMRTKRSTSVKNVEITEITTKSWSFSLIQRGFQSKSLVNDRKLRKHYNGDDHQVLREVICTTFRLVEFVSAKTEQQLQSDVSSRRKFRLTLDKKVD